MFSSLDIIIKLLLHLLLNLNSADNVPNSTFNAILKIQTSRMFVYAIL